MWTFELDCFIKAIGIFLVYNIISCILFGIPSSLSETYYLFKEKNKYLGWLFTITMIFSAVCLMPCWIEISEGSNFQFLSFLSAASIVFVGATPAFKDCKLESKVHTIGAICAAIFALLWIIFVTKFWWIILVWCAICAIFAFSTKTFKSSYVYWFEMIEFGATFTTIILHFLIK